MTAKRWPILMLVAACLLGAPKPAAAMAIANSSIAFKNLAITPVLGTFALDGPWLLEAFAHADNSLREADIDFVLSPSPDTVVAAAAISKGRGTLTNSFTLSDSGNVQFDIDVAGVLNVMTSGRGLSASTETVFTLEVDGTPVLFRQDLLSIGPDDAAMLAFAEHL